MASSDSQSIFLKNFHKNNNAKFVLFAGHEMPINYKTGIINEHNHVRNHAGIFDVSHMGQILIPLTNQNIASLEVYIPLSLETLIFNKCHYSFFLNSNGGIIDDIMLSKINSDNKEYIYIVYNSSRKNILKKIFDNNLNDFNIINDRCLLAIQGPDSYKEVKKILNISSDMKFLNIKIIHYKNDEIYISRSGYTGEDGFELSIKNKMAEEIITKILNNNVILCGLGCRDSLRVEAGLSLYGNEINEEITPVQAGLSWALNKNRLNDERLSCNKILQEQLNSPLSIKKIGLSSVNKTMLRNHMIIHNNDYKEIGYITSGCYSPVLKKSIAIGYINNIPAVSDLLYVNVRGKFEEIKEEKIPFIRKNYKKGD